MRIESEKLIHDLIERTVVNIKEVEKFRTLTIEQLNWRYTSESWSVLECLEHLNLYGDFYIPEIEKQINNTKLPRVAVFKSGFLGNYFAESMLPKERLNKMKTFKDKNPMGSKLDKATIERFIMQQEQLLSLLNRAKMVDLGKVKTGISITKWIKLKLGDTLRVIIYHNERHIVQANKLVDKMKANQ